MWACIFFSSFLSALNRLKNGRRFPASASLPTAGRFAIHLLESPPVQFNLIFYFFFTLPLKQTHRHTSTKAGNSPLGTRGTGKQTALLSVSPFEFSVTASLLKRSTFYYEVEIRISIISSTNPPPPLHGWCTTFTGA